MITFILEIIVTETRSIEMEQTDLVVTVGNYRYSYLLSEYNPIRFIYTDVYGDPDAHFDELLRVGLRAQIFEATILD